MVYLYCIRAIIRHVSIQNIFGLALCKTTMTT